MAIIRTQKKENPFVQIDKTFLEDENLSWEAKGLLAYLLSRPDNWKVNQKDLKNRSADGHAKVESALLCLLANGYVNWYAKRDNQGHIEEWFYDVYERPEFNPEKEKCIAEGNMRIEKKKERNKKKNNKRLSQPQKVDNSKKLSPESDNPELDNPELGNPELDNPNYNNNNINNNDLNNNDLNNNQNLNQDFDFNNRFKNIKIPTNLYFWFGKRVNQLLKDTFDVYELEEFYNTSEFIVPNAAKDDIEHLNDYEFSNIVKSLYNNAERPITSTKGILKAWTLKGLSYKRETILNSVDNEEIEEIDFLNNHLVDRILKKKNEDELPY